MNKNIPLGLVQLYDKDTNQTYLSWSYAEDADIDYWEIEYYDEEKRRWMPYDGRNGVLKKK